MAPKCPLPKIYLPSTSRNTHLQGDKHLDQNIEADQVLNDDTDGDNVSDTNKEDEIHRLIQDTFSPIDKDIQDDSHDVDPLLEKSCQPLLNGLSNTCLTQILRCVIC